MLSPSWARNLAEQHLAGPLPRRWRHVQAVVEQANTVAATLDGDGDLLVCAAWLHDIGYAPPIASTGFHPLDGARLIRRLDGDDRLAGLVAHHSGAAVEAGLRGLSEQLHAEFPRERSTVADALWYADLTTGPDGQRVTVDERLAEIERRYGTGHVVTASVRLSRPELLAAVDRTLQRSLAQPRYGCGSLAKPRSIRRRISG